MRSLPEPPRRPTSQPTRACRPVDVAKFVKDELLFQSCSGGSTRYAVEIQGTAQRIPARVPAGERHEAAEAAGCTSAQGLRGMPRVATPTQSAVLLAQVPGRVLEA